MIQSRVKLHNRFDFEIYDIETGITEKGIAQAENIVLNALFTRLCSNTAGNYARIGVGSGTGTLSPARTGLFSQLVAPITATTLEIVYDTETTAHITKFAVFDELTANGTWTEVGLAHTNTSTAYVTHALITDSEGNPITINKTNTKIITVYATVFVELLTPPSGQLVPRYIRSNILVRQMLDLAPSAGTAFFFSSLLTTDGRPSNIAVHSYISGGTNSDTANKRRYSSLSRLATGSGNYPIRGIFWSDSSSYGVDEGYGSITLPASGLFEGWNYSGVSIGTGNGSAVQFDLPVSFVKPNSETIYVDGVPKTRGVDYTIHYGMKSTDTMILDMPEAVYRRGYFYAQAPYLEEVIVLPQPPGGESTITSVVIKNGTTGNSCGGYEVSLSLDGSTWVSAGTSSSWNSSVVATLNTFTPAQYKYIKIRLSVSANNYLGLSYIRIYATPPTVKNISFTTAPANNAAITANFSTDFINKTSNFVLDVQSEVIYGEG